MTDQLAFDLGGAPAASDESFIVSAANAQAADAVARGLDWRSPGLVLIGPEASGKTHLTRAWAARVGAGVVDARDLASTDLAQLVSPPALLIEDMDRGRADETALFHLFNALREADRRLLITSRAPVSTWRIALADLRSRLTALPAVCIDAPDDALLARLATKLFADRQIAVSADVIDYVLARMERSPAAVARFVEEADRVSLATKRPITRNLVAETLRRIDRGNHADHTAIDDAA